MCVCVCREMGVQCVCASEGVRTTAVEGKRGKGGRGGDGGSGTDVGASDESASNMAFGTMDGSLLENFSEPPSPLTPLSSHFSP